MEDIFDGLVLLMGGFVFIFAIIALAVAILMIIANIFLFPMIFLPMLAFGQATYIGNQTTPGKLF